MRHLKRGIRRVGKGGEVSRKGISHPSKSAPRAAPDQELVCGVAADGGKRKIKRKIKSKTKIKRKSKSKIKTGVSLREVLQWSGGSVAFSGRNLNLHPALNRLPNLNLHLNLNLNLPEEMVR
jgi:hypothetical protein